MNKAIEKPIRSLRKLSLALKENRISKLDYFKSYFKLINNDIEDAVALNELLSKE